MRTPARTLIVWLTLALVGGCGPGTTTYDATGTVVAVKPEQRILKIDHEEIPGFMPAMTMNFDVSSGTPIDELRVGDSIRFTIERTPRTLRVIKIEKGTSSGGEAVPEDDNAGISPLRSQVAPAISLMDQEGREFNLESLRGRVVLLDFIFTSCTGPCPILTADHVRLQRRIPPEIKAQVHFLSVSIDPTEDTPAKLKAYARSQGANMESWSFLTGSVDAVDEVLQSYFVGSVRLPDETLNHTVVTYLIDPEGKIWNHYLGLEHGSDKMMADILEIVS